MPLSLRMPLRFDAFNCSNAYFSFWNADSNVLTTWKSVFTCAIGDVLLLHGCRQIRLNSIAVIWCALVLHDQYKNAMRYLSQTILFNIDNGWHYTFRHLPQSVFLRIRFWLLIWMMKCQPLGRHFSITILRKLNSGWNIGNCEVFFFSIGSLSGTNCGNIMQSETLVFSMPKQARRRFQGFITSPADHVPTSLTLHCPVQWHTLFCKVFQDESVFRRSIIDPHTVLVNIKQDLPSWITERYAWALNFNKPLSKACILPKPSRNFANPRPIVNYIRSWPKQVGFVLSIVFQTVSKSFILLYWVIATFAQ